MSLRAPLGLKIINLTAKRYERFGKCVMANYQLLGLHFEGEELFHMLTQPPEIYLEENSYTEHIHQTNIQSTREWKLELLCNLFNRLLYLESEHGSYQDIIFAESVLQKMGIRDRKEFLLRMQKQFRESRLTEEITVLYEKQKDTLKNLLSQTIYLRQGQQVQAKTLPKTEPFRRERLLEGKGAEERREALILLAEKGKSETEESEETESREKEAVLEELLREAAGFKNTALQETLAAVQRLLQEKTEAEKEISRLKMAAEETVLQRKTEAGESLKQWEPQREERLWQSELRLEKKLKQEAVQREEKLHRQETQQEKRLYQNELQLEESLSQSETQLAESLKQSELRFKESLEQRGLQLEERLYQNELQLGEKRQQSEGQLVKRLNQSELQLEEKWSQRKTELEAKLRQEIQLLQKQLRQEQRLSGKEPGQKQAEAQAEPGESPVKALHNSIFARLEVERIFKELALFHGSSSKAAGEISSRRLQLLEQSSLVREVRLSRLKAELAEETQELFYCRNNPYEADIILGQDSQTEMLQQMAKAVLFQAVEALYEGGRQEIEAGKEVWYQWQGSFLHIAQNTAERLENYARSPGVVYEFMQGEAYRELRQKERTKLSEILKLVSFTKGQAVRGFLPNQEEKAAAVLKKLKLKQTSFGEELQTAAQEFSALDRSPETAFTEAPQQKDSETQRIKEEIRRVNRENLLAFQRLQKEKQEETSFPQAIDRKKTRESARLLLENLGRETSRRQVFGDTGVVELSGKEETEDRENRAEKFSIEKMTEESHREAYLQTEEKEAEGKVAAGKTITAEHMVQTRNRTKELQQVLKELLACYAEAFQKPQGNPDMRSFGGTKEELIWFYSALGEEERTNLLEEVLRETAQSKGIALKQTEVKETAAFIESRELPVLYTGMTREEKKSFWNRLKPAEQWELYKYLTAKERTVLEQSVDRETRNFMLHKLQKEYTRLQKQIEKSRLQLQTELEKIRTTKESEAFQKLLYEENAAEYKEEQLLYQEHKAIWVGSLEKKRTVDRKEQQLLQRAEHFLSLERQLLNARTVNRKYFKEHGPAIQELAVRMEMQSDLEAFAREKEGLETVLPGWLYTAQKWKEHNEKQIQFFQKQQVLQSLLEDTEETGDSSLWHKETMVKNLKTLLKQVKHLQEGNRITSRGKEEYRLLQSFLHREYPQGASKEAADSLRNLLLEEAVYKAHTGQEEQLVRIHREDTEKIFQKKLRQRGRHTSVKTDRKTVEAPVLVHKQTADLLTEELWKEERKNHNKTKEYANLTEKHKSSHVQNLQTQTESSSRNRQVQEKILMPDLESQIKAISDQVYSKIEKKFLSDRRRRGY